MAQFMITCPYCFKKFEDNRVHFRLMTAHKVGTQAPLPEGYDDWDEVATRFPSGAEKDRLMAENAKHQFFTQRRDEKYQKFWDTFGGMTTELSQDDGDDAVEPYLRPVVDPHNVQHQRYLRIQTRLKDGTNSYLHYDGEGMADSITDLDGKVSNMRVCPDCHNPLPVHYGKNPVKFISVIGVSGAGKTVYLSQLVRNIVDYAGKVGLSAFITSGSTRRFLSENPVKMGVPLPGSTQPETFVQPMFYDLAKTVAGGATQGNTIVLYDIAGENCTNNEKMASFGSFVRHSDGMILLLDPKQLPFVNSDGYGDIEQVTAVLNTLYMTITGGQAGKSRIPMAVCIPKADKPSIQQIFAFNPNEDVVMYQPPTPPKKPFSFKKPTPPPPEYRADLDVQRLLIEDVKNLVDPQTRLPVPIFYSTEYNAISRKLTRMIGKYVSSLGLLLNTNYEHFNFFAFSALGCDVHEVEENGLKISKPVSAISPKRIEEPLYWLFCQFGYVTPSEPLARPFSGQ